MTAAQYKRAIAKLGLSQERSGLLFGASPRSGQRWANGERPVPGAVAMLIKLLMAGKITLDDIKP